MLSRRRNAGSQRWMWRAIAAVAILMPLLTISAVPNSLAQDDSEPLRIAILFPFSGDLSDFGPPFANAAQIAVDQINASGGVNGQPIEYPGRDIAQSYGTTAVLPHVVGPHRSMEEAHVYEDVMQLVDWIREDKPTVATAEHARHVIEIFDAAYRSAASGQAQTLRTTF